VKVWWRSGHLPARRSDLRKSLQTDGRTDDGCRAIALAHSWNELKIIMDIYNRYKRLVIVKISITVVQFQLHVIVIGI